MRKETRKDLALLIITSIASVIGMTSVFLACRPLAWIALLVSDSYLFLVLLFAAILSDDHGFATRYSWITSLFPRRTAGLFLPYFASSLNRLRFCGFVCWSRGFFIQQNAIRCALH